MSYHKTRLQTVSFLEEPYNSLEIASVYLFCRVFIFLQSGVLCFMQFHFVS